MQCDHGKFSTTSRSLSMCISNDLVYCYSILFQRQYAFKITHLNNLQPINSIPNFVETFMHKLSHYLYYLHLCFLLSTCCVNGIWLTIVHRHDFGYLVTMLIKTWLSVTKCFLELVNLDVLDMVEILKYRSLCTQIYYIISLLLFIVVLAINVWKYTSKISRDDMDSQNLLYCVQYS